MIEVSGWTEQGLMVQGKVGVAREIGGAWSMSWCGKTVKASCSALAPRVDTMVRTKLSQHRGSMLEEGEP